MTAAVEQPRPQHVPVPDAPAGPDRGLLTLALEQYAAVFTTLSKLVLAPPSPYLLDRVRTAEILDEWPLLMNADCRRGTALLVESRIAGESAERIAADYRRLFTGPTPKAPPHESAHRSAGELGAVAPVAAAYQRFGFATASRGAAPRPDHIAQELAFAATLCVRGMDALASGDHDAVLRVRAALEDFLRDHLLRWGPRFLERTANAAQSYFFQGVAALGHGSLASARETFLTTPGPSV